ncbi:MAG: family 10 glycosylhydrolase [Prevotellaceae bacterium]|jgi:uncharacterized lipoprotein YddW (UPF0748 family)|nr:family 10 glycosylhydrolase [Prevotellaceae bacterium]
MNMKRVYFVCLYTLLFALPLTAQSPQSTPPKREFRGAWIQVVNNQFRGLPTAQIKQNLINQLNSLQQAGINAILFQVRPEADALYDSAIEPWSRYLTGTQGRAPFPFWDPLQFMIDECHKRCMELHAWINPYRTKTSLTNELAPSHLYFSHPEWFVTYGNQLFFDPGLPESRDYIAKVVSDLVSRYDVDAIHIDDYFYPYPIAGQDFPDNASFARYGGGFTNKADWRRDNVSLLIRKLHETIHSLKPWVKFGVAPFGIYRNESTDPLGSLTNGLQNYDDLYADVLLWAHRGWIDYNIPQIYWQIGHPRADYETLVDWWARHAANRPLFIGQSVMNTLENADPQHPERNQLTRKMALQRAYQSIGGSCQWYAAAVVENRGGYRDSLMYNYHRYPALMPVFDFIDNQAPNKVRKVKAVWTADGYLLFWSPPKIKKKADDYEMNRPVAYVVYRFTHKKEVDLENPANIVAVTNNPWYKLPYTDGKTKYYYVVTALDRLHNESKLVRKKVKL